jgi:hypothetical protein
MNYKQCTRRLKIPVHGMGDPLSPPVEMQRFQIIENMLLAGTKGVRNCVFDDGLFELNPETDSTYVATVRATGHSPSAIGMVGGAYFEAPPTVSWPGLKKGYSYYLYLRGNSATLENFNEVKAVSSTYALDGDNLLLAMADCRSEQPKLEPYPDGKLYSDDLARHVNDVENPHGRELLQDVLYVRQKLALYSPEGDSADIEVLVEGNPVTVPASAIPGAVAELAGRKIITVDFTTAGAGGRIIGVKEAATVIFVQVSRCFAGGILGTLGETAIGYFDSDSKLHAANEFSFYNTGDSGLPMRALVYCG